MIFENFLFENLVVIKRNFVLENLVVIKRKLQDGKKISSVGRKKKEGYKVGLT